MVNRRTVITGGLSAAAVVTVAGAAAIVRGSSGSVQSVEVGTAAPSAAAPTTPPPAASAGVAPSAVTAISTPATVSTPADREDTPLRVDWVGGSDIAWEQVSLPDSVVRRLPTFADRAIYMRTRVDQAVMAPDVRGFVRDAVAAGTDAIIMSINPVWLHWDQEACNDIAVQHERYDCLLTPIDPALTEQRRAELQALVDEAVGAGVPLYVYTQPHSTDALTDPLLIPRLAAAEEAIAAFDPGRPDVRFRSRIFTRDVPSLREGVEFIDMVHPTAAGAELLADWLAADIGGFWSSIDFGR